MTQDSDKAFERRRGHGFLPLLRWFERRSGTRPRVGQSRRVGEEIVDLGQDPFMGFPDSDLSDVDLGATPPKVRPRFLGFFGPFGALPLAMTREVEHWLVNGHPGFTRFSDMLVSRFLQLFYRSWSDARPITHFDHPSGGNFPDQLRAFTGDSGKSYRNLGSVNDVVRLRYTALHMGRVKSPVRLQQILRAHFKADIEIEEFAASWLEFAPEELSSLGFCGSRLEQDAKLGCRTVTTEEKAVIHIRCHSRDELSSFLPGRNRHRELVDLVQGYVGQFFSFEVQLWLPSDELIAAQLGVSTELGWMAVLRNSEEQETNIGGGLCLMPASSDTVKLVLLCTYQFGEKHSSF